MLVIVTAYKTKNRKRETPEILYFGHDRSKAKKVTIPEGYKFIETQLVPPGYNRRFAKPAKVEAKDWTDDLEGVVAEKAAAEEVAAEKAEITEPISTTEPTPPEVVTEQTTDVKTTAPADEAAAEGQEMLPPEPSVEESQPELVETPKQKGRNAKKK